MTPINCPFCGGATICDPLPTGYHQVFCRSVITCGAAGSPRPTSDEAIAMWNRRAGQHVQATEPALSWRCFHCDYLATTREQALAHFGAPLSKRTPSCIAGVQPVDGVEVLADEKPLPQSEWDRFGIERADLLDARSGTVTAFVRHGQRIRIQATRGVPERVMSPSGKGNGGVDG